MAQSGVARLEASARRAAARCRGGTARLPERVGRERGGGLLQNGGILKNFNVKDNAWDHMYICKNHVHKPPLISSPSCVRLRPCKRVLEGNALFRP